ncbi:SMI1/KNR4 family protein [Peribacillus simplex]|uniref:SMI1/KNR4 family protein n=2 Tax=Peribacillus simplex TaxID=1478 RepID=UPI00202CC5B8|nr:SMI1/KNR4 family protein [Peribacillus simplex]
MFGLGTDDDLISQFETYKNRIPNTCIPIGRDAGGNLVCLNLSEGKYGNVYFWDHEEELKYEEGKITIKDLYFITKTFKEFFYSIGEITSRNQKK